MNSPVQETGRAGRDGLPAICVLLFDLSDRRIQQFFLAGRYPGVELAQRLYDTLAARCREAPDGVTLAELEDALPDVGGGKLEVALAMLVDARIAGRDRRRRYRVWARDGARDGVRDAVAKAAGQFEAVSNHDRETLQHMIDYAQTGQCRWRAILAYYGDTPTPQRRGVCDNCVSPPQIEPVQEAIAMGGPSSDATASGRGRVKTREPELCRATCEIAPSQFPFVYD